MKHFKNKKVIKDWIKSIKKTKIKINNYVYKF
jgi:hypothetical protein